LKRPIEGPRGGLKESTAPATLTVTLHVNGVERKLTIAP
jgi:hypothetical protein